LFLLLCLSQLFSSPTCMLRLFVPQAFTQDFADLRQDPTLSGVPFSSLSEDTEDSFQMLESNDTAVFLVPLRRDDQHDIVLFGPDSILNRPLKQAILRTQGKVAIVVRGGSERMQRGGLASLCSSMKDIAERGLFFFWEEIFPSSLGAGFVQLQRRAEGRVLQMQPNKSAPSVSSLWSQVSIGVVVMLLLALVLIRQYDRKEALQTWETQLKGVNSSIFQDQLALSQLAQNLSAWESQIKENRTRWEEDVKSWESELRNRVQNNTSWESSLQKREKNTTSWEEKLRTWESELRNRVQNNTSWEISLQKREKNTTSWEERLRSWESELLKNKASMPESTTENVTTWWQWRLWS